tara:strand:- start:3094 stop:4683 length:1590 start_codon:yes stop_codon:yes gene_type:complete
MYFLSSSSLKTWKKKLYVLTLLIFSISINQYYGFIGIFPEDSFIIFNSGYDTLNGYYPFKDYWTTTGPLLDVIQAIFFKIFGVSWFSYILHASFFNFLIALATFLTLSKFGLNINFCFFYALSISILAYPNAGSPFMDHHSNILSTISLFAFILALKTKSNFYWFVLPILLCLSFLAKQVPAAYVALIVTFLSLIYFAFNFNVKKILAGFSGLLFFVILYVLIMSAGNISLLAFFEQYILFPQSMGKDRLDLLFPLEFKRVVLRFKLIHLSLLILFAVVIKKMIKDLNYLKSAEFFIILSLITFSFSLIVAQLMTINAKYIYFIIPVLVGFSHIYYKKYFDNKKYIFYFLIVLTVSSTVWYHHSYNASRKFMDLGEVNLKKAVNAKILSDKFNKLKWITVLQPDNPEKEINEIQKNMDIIKNDKRRKTIVTDYQFMSVFLSIYDFSPNRVWHSGANYPEINHKYFLLYKKFFLKKLIENKVEVVYVVKPLWGDDDVLRNILNQDCYSKEIINDNLIEQSLLNCEQLKKK